MVLVVDNTNLIVVCNPARCKGRKDGRVGLYPANYIEVIN